MHAVRLRSTEVSISCATRPNPGLDARYALLVEVDLTLAFHNESATFAEVMSLVRRTSNNGLLYLAPLEQAPQSCKCDRPQGYEETSAIAVSLTSCCLTCDVAFRLVKARQASVQDGS